MPYDTALENRLEQLVPELGNFTKKKMFGGIGYLLNGNMAFGIHKEYLVIRIAPELSKQLLNKESISRFNMTRQPMPGWLMIAPEGVKTNGQLQNFLKMAVRYAETLPTKTK